MIKLLPLLTLLVALPASATELTSTGFEATFHITHPAKEYDTTLLAGGGEAVLELDASDFSKSTVLCTLQVGQFNSHNTRRDSHMLETLEGLIFPTITWKVDSIALKGPLTPGAHETFASGPLTIREHTADLKVPVTITVSDAGAITVDSSFSISLDEWDVERPTLLFVPIEDNLPIRIHVTFPADASVLAPPPAVPELPPHVPESSPSTPTEEAK